MAEGLTKQYGDTSTTMRMMLDIDRATSGTTTFCGRQFRELESLTRYPGSPHRGDAARRSILQCGGQRLDSTELGVSKQEVPVHRSVRPALVPPKGTIMKRTLSVLAVAATVLAACGGDDDAEISDATPQGRLTIALSDEYETIFDVDRACVEEKTAVLTDEQAERAIEQITAEAVDPDLQDWLSSTTECISEP